MPEQINEFCQAAKKEIFVVNYKDYFLKSKVASYFPLYGDTDLRSDLPSDIRI